ncbi:MAG: glycosyltransferase family 4 protein [Nitrososphaerales archaeon]
MRVAFLVGSTHGIPRLGGEARVFHMAKFLATSGIEVDLFGSRFQEELIGHNMSQCQSFRSWSGGDLYPLSMKSLLGLTKTIPSLIRQTRVLRGYDAIISELGSAWQVLGSREICRLPMVLDEHNEEWHLMRQQEISLGKPYPWRRLRAYEKICHAAFDHVLVVSAIDKLAFEANGTPGRKMTIVPNGVDTAVFRPNAGLGQIIRKEYRLGQDDLLLMYMGSLKFFPNVDAVSSILRTIYPKARAILPNLKLMITGPGSENLSNSTPYEVISTGVVDRSSLPSYINAADLCLAPLRFGSGTRFKILEWMACGKAIIATRKAVEGLDVTHEDNVILEDDIEEYPALISQLCRDHDLRATLGKNARVLVEKTYGWEKCFTPLEELLRRL